MTTTVHSGEKNLIKIIIKTVPFIILAVTEYKLLQFVTNIIFKYGQNHCMRNFNRF